MRKPYGAIPADEKTFIRRYRLEANLTLEELGERVGVTGQSVQRWETGGSVSVDTLYQLAEVFGCSPADLLPGGEQMSEEEELLLRRFREASLHDRRAISTLARGLQERETQPDFEIRKAGGET